MLQAKINSNSITTIKDLDSVVDWFEQHKKSFYALGWSYLGDQQHMEELFFRSILKAQKEFPRFKKETSFDTWVTSIFIQICRELSSDTRMQDIEETEPRKELIRAFSQLKENERDAIVLTYVKGASHEETAYFLNISVEKVKEYLFSGIRTIRKEMGDQATYSGCKEYHKDYIDYLEKNMERQKKIEFEMHLYHCHDCQEDLSTFQEVMLTMVTLSERMEDFIVPANFMDKVRNRLAEKEKYRQQKISKRKKMGFVIGGIFMILVGIGFFTGALQYVYYTWTEDNLELRSFLQQGQGERLNLEAESNGVKITIKSAIADEVQTLIYYEIEDTKEDNQYFMDYYDGVVVENEWTIMSQTNYRRYYPPDLESDINKKEKNVYQGKISLLPLNTENETIKLKITKLQKVLDNTNPYESVEYEIGEWKFEIPVTKQSSAEFVLDEEMEVEGIPVRFEKLIIAPTATVLQYGINIEQQEKRIDYLNFDHLEVNDKKVRTDIYGSSFVDSQQEVNWLSYQAYFDPFLEEKAREVNVQLGPIQLTYNDHKFIELDASQTYPQTFDYAGSTISIDKVELGRPTKVVLSNHELKNRVYESLNFTIVGEVENDQISMEMDHEAVLIDKNGKEYDMNKAPVPYEEIEQPRNFLTVQSLGLHSNNNVGEIVIPKRLEIFGYSTTKYLDDVVKITLD